MDRGGAPFCHIIPLRFGFDLPEQYLEQSRYCRRSSAERRTMLNNRRGQHLMAEVYAAAEHQQCGVVEATRPL